MGKKRRSEVSAETDVPVKKEKVPEFNGTEFKVMLMNPTTAMKGKYICNTGTRKNALHKLINKRYLFC